MEALGGAAAVLAVLELTVEIGKLCGKYIGEVRNAQDEIGRLQSKISALEGVMTRLQALPPSEMDVTAVKQCFDDLDPIRKKLKPKERHSLLNRMHAKSLKWPFSSKEIRDQVQAVERYLLIFNTNLQLNISDRTTDAEQDRLLDKLAYVGDAILTSHRTSRRHRQCLPGTRVDVLQQIMDWTVNTSPQCIFWLKGLAGTGKSTITTTLASKLKENLCPLASYFFERGHSELAHVQKLIPTIVRQLAKFSPAYLLSVLAAIKADPDVGSSADLREQYEALLLGPLRQIQPSGPSDKPFIIIIDALDECDDEQDLRMLINLFATTTDLPNLRIKIFVSSRPDLLRHGFEDMPSILHYTMVLHDVPRAVVDNDIRIYLHHELEATQKKFRLPIEWPPPEALETLAAKAGGLFIFAATACRFIGGASHAKPQKRLDQICGSTTTNKLMTEELDQMYTLVLQNSIKGDYTSEEQESTESLFRHVVGTIVILLDPLPISELFKLLSGPELETEEELETMLETLHSVIDVPEDPSKPVKALHLSFHDFLLDPNRCSDRRFSVIEEQANQILASDCLRLLSSTLKRNMCGLSLEPLRDEIDPAVIERTLSPSTQYACRHWAEHVFRSKSAIDDHGPVHTFLQLHFLHWLECMSLIGRVSETVNTLRNLLSISDMPSSSAHDFFNDCHLFVVNFRHMIGIAPQQLYISALVFSPPQSLVRENFASIVPGWIKCNPPLRDTWPSSQTVIEVPYRVHRAFFVAGDRSVATVSRRSKSSLLNFDLWDAQTGARQINSVPASRELKIMSFSPDGLTILMVFPDDALKLWDIAKKDFRFSLGGGGSGITCVTFSEDSNSIVVGYHDGTVRRLETRTGATRKLFVSDARNVSALKISPDNRFIAIYEAKETEGTLTLWDGEEHSCQLMISPERTRSLVNRWVLEDQLAYTGRELEDRLAFSPDGKLLAVTVQNHAVQVWDLATRTIQLNVQDRSQNDSTSIAVQLLFSADSKHLVVCSTYDVDFWELTTGNSRSENKSKDIRYITAIKFSLNEEFTALGSLDGHVRVYNKADQDPHLYEGHDYQIRAIDFSKDGNLILAANPRIVRVWKFQKTSPRLLGEHEGDDKLDRIVSVMLSPDGRTAVTASFRGEMSETQIWDCETGDCRFKYKRRGLTTSSSIRSNNQMLLSTAGEDTLIVDVYTGSRRPVPDGECHTLSRDGQLLAFGHQGRAIPLWDVQQEKEVFRITYDCPDLDKLVFSSDNVFLASSLQSGEVMIWRTHSGECVSTIRYDFFSTPMLFSPNNELLATQNIDRVHLWDIRANRSRADLHVPKFTIKLHFSFDGRLVAFKNHDCDMVTVLDTQIGDTVMTVACHSRYPGIDFLAGVNALFIDGIPHSTSSAKLTKAELATCSHTFPALQIERSLEWVTKSSERILWLPPELRTAAYKVCGNRIAIAFGCRMIFLTFADEVDGRAQFEEVE
ncbi:MAG: hypothetical protein Q9168_003809 [Polycauliona sp. 1 TL-2023]